MATVIPIVPVISEIDCPHCIWMSSKGIFHKKTCRCSHHHADHVFGGGCLKCKCDEYDQSTAPRIKLEDEDEELVPEEVEEIGSIAD